MSFSSSADALRAVDSTSISAAPPDHCTSVYASCRKTAWVPVEFCRQRPEGVLGEGTASPSPPVRGLEERCKLPLRGPGGAAQQFFCTSRFPCSLFCYSCTSPSICMQQGVLCQPPLWGQKLHEQGGVTSCSTGLPVSSHPGVRTPLFGTLIGSYTHDPFKQYVAATECR